jgi:hypothetical protein
VSADGTCHDLLVQLAGRLPDAVLWRLRDWLGAGGYASVAAVLPRELLRHRVGLVDDEREMLAASAGQWGASTRLMDAVLPLAAPEPVTVSFSASPQVGPEIDTAALAVLGVVRGHPGSQELRQAWRSGAAADQRVVLVLGGDRPWTLAATVQRVLRAHDDRTPSVEVLPPHGQPPAYHQAAIIGSGLLWRAGVPAVIGA